MKRGGTLFTPGGTQGQASKVASKWQGQESYAKTWLWNKSSCRRISTHNLLDTGSEPKTGELHTTQPVSVAESGQ